MERKKKGKKESTNMWGERIKTQKGVCSGGRELEVPYEGRELKNVQRFHAELKSGGWQKSTEERERERVCVVVCCVCVWKWEVSVYKKKKRVK